MMQHVMVGFQAEDPYGLDGRQVTARGLHGVLYHVLQQVDPQEASWLHGHASPKPYSLSPYYTQDGRLAGLRLAAVTEKTAQLFIQGWKGAQQRGERLQLGRQTFRVRGLEHAPGPTFADLAHSHPDDTLALRFLSPTTFRQGPGTLPLPMPGNVFSWPYRVWCAFAPEVLALPPDWPDWCSQNVFVTAHRIETASIALDRQVTLAGFVGDVIFTAHHDGRKDEVSYRHAWQALGQLAAFCGVGYKTTMGMGAVERV